MPEMPAQHADTAKIARIENMGGRNDAGEGHRLGSQKGKPPMPLVKSGNERYRETSTDEAPQAHPQFPPQLRQPPEFDTSFAPSSSSLLRLRETQRDHLPSVALMPSHTAPTKPVTITVIAALKV